MKISKLLVAAALSFSGFLGFVPSAQSNPYAPGYYQRSNPYADGYIQDSNPYADGYVQDKSLFGYW